MSALRHIRFVVVVSVFAICASPFTVARAQRGQTDAPPVPMAQSSSQMDRMAVRFVSSKSGEPLEGVELRFTGRLGIRSMNNRTLKSNAEGVAELAYSSGATTTLLRFTTKKSGFVPVHYEWEGRQQPAALPKELEVKLDPGFKMGGIVQDEEGKPIAGAVIDLYMPVTWPPRDSYVFTLANPRTDAQGRWEFDSAPADTSRLNVSVSHPSYLESYGGSRSLGMDNILVMKQGISISGKVVDQEGKPVMAAQVFFGTDLFGSDAPETATDAEGQFTLRNCRPGGSAVTVRAAGFAPAIQRVAVAAKNEPLSFTLEPGRVLRLRVVDKDGKPLSGVTVVPDTWRGMRTLYERMTTTAEGRLAWRSAPPDAVLFDILRLGYMSKRNHELIATDEEQVVTLTPPLEISGRVTDAATGEPIKRFSLRQGQARENGVLGASYWQDETTSYSDGTFNYRLDDSSTRLIYRVEADGYLPAESRRIDSTEGKIALEFALKAGAGAKGVVVLPSGEPAAGAPLGRVTESNSMSLHMGQLQRSSRSTSVVTTDLEGKFTLMPQTDSEPFLLVVVHDGGFARVTSKELETQNCITLAPWGKITGRAMKGTKPDANRPVAFNERRQETDRLSQRVYSGYQTMTDGEGRFQIDRVIPGPGTVARSVSISFGDYSNSFSDAGQEITVRGGETTEVTIGGTGRAVTGRIVTDREPDAAIPWITNSPARVSARSAANANPNSVSNTQYLGVFDESGKFSVSDVPAGEYMLSVTLTAAALGWERPEIGSATFEFKIPEMPGGRSDEPLDLGEITAKLKPVLSAGDEAPAFELAGLKDEKLNSADFKGKLVYVMFLPVVEAGGAADMAMYKRIHEQFGKNPNFVMLTIWCGGQYQRSGQSVVASTLPWKEAIVPGLQSAVPQAYKVHAMPVTYLIGMNGRIILRSAKEAELKTSIDSLLSLGELFEAGK